MLAVIAVNAGMVWAAMHTFPGQAGSDGFDLSNRYDRVIDRVQQQARWAGTCRRPPIRNGTRCCCCTPARVRLWPAQCCMPPRNVRWGRKHATPLTFHEVAPGRYVADAELDARGQWDVLLSATAQGHTYTTTRRILVR